MDLVEDHSADLVEDHSADPVADLRAALLVDHLHANVSESADLSAHVSLDARKGAGAHLDLDPDLET